MLSKGVFSLSHNIQRYHWLAFITPFNNKQITSLPCQLDPEFPEDKYLITFNINGRALLAKYQEHKYLLGK